MIKIKETRDKNKLEKFFRGNTPWHIYAIADLDEPFWEDTCWITAQQSGEIVGAVLVLTTLDLPIVYGICLPGDQTIRHILSAVQSELPRKFFAHVGLDVLTSLKNPHFEREGEYFKMKMVRPPASQNGIYSVEQETDYLSLKTFYDQCAYGDDREQRFFAPYMLEMNPYHVIRDVGEIVSAAGVHVASKHYQVAAIGNIATSPAVRGKGYGAAVTESLIFDLRGRFKDIGLNVRADNVPALRCYAKLGFEACLAYEEGIVHL